MDDIRIAAISSHCPVEHLSENLATTAKWVQRAKAARADVVCFPELNLSGYSLQARSNARAAAHYEEFFRQLSHLARDRSIGIIAGTVRAEGGTGRYLPTQLFFSSEAGEVGAYAKIHLAPPEQDLFGAGTRLPLFRLGQVKFGIQLCYDAHFPELSTRLALSGADIIFIPHASPHGEPADKYHSWMRHLPARAFDNGVFVVACNQSGDNGQGLSFPGLALVIGPDGRVLAEQTGPEQMLVADLLADDLQAVRRHRMRYFLPHRRPALY